MFLYKYKVRFFDDIERQMELAEGYVFGTSEADAYEIFNRTYGDGIDRTELIFIDEIFSGPIFETKGIMAENRRSTEKAERDNIW